ncbi:hypothetical protein HY641_00240 [Candidatus Woesearchaeota archaeon]|nr:hypothetical protein [Candidatus Woesearchaeota archaeon]
MVAILVWVAVLASLYAVIGIDDTDRQNCPYKSGGNPNASLRIAYFGNPFCIWCLILEPKLERLVEQKGRSFYIQYFDDRYCVNEAEAFGVQAVPFFVFNKSGVITPHAGYIEESDMRSIICQETGDC